jgi:hypothetical protein
VVDRPICDRRKTTMELRGDRARRPDFVVLPPPHDRFFTRGALSRWHNRSGPRHGDADVDPRWSTTPAHFDLLFDALDVRRVELDVPDQDMYRGSRACRWHRRGARARLPDIDSGARHSFAATQVHALQALQMCASSARLSPQSVSALSIPSYHTRPQPVHVRWKCSSTSPSA